MAQQILGSLQNIEIDVAGGSSYKNLVCLRTSSVNTTVDSTTEQTNCGPMTSVADPTMSVDFDAVCEVAPTITQVSYEFKTQLLVVQAQVLPTTISSLDLLPHLLGIKQLLNLSISLVLLLLPEQLMLLLNYELHYYYYKRN